MTGLAASRRFAVPCALLAAGAVLPLSGCGGGRPHRRVEMPSYTPSAAPTAFTRHPIASLPGTNLATAGGRAYAYHDGLIAYRLRNGTTAWHAAVGNPANRFAIQHTPPRVGGGLVVGAFATGDSEDSTHAITVRAVHAGSGKIAWTAQIAKDPGEYPAELEIPRVVGANGRYVLVAAKRSGSSSGISAVVRVDNGRPVWTDDDLNAFDLDGAVASGVRADDALTGVSAADGHRLWTTHPVVGQPTGLDPGSGLTAVTGLPQGAAGPGETKTLFLDPETGATTFMFGTPLNQCYYDHRSIGACVGGSSAVGVDTRSGRELWRLPAGGQHRATPRITAAWRGRIYAVGGLVLDARSGHRRARVGATLTHVDDRFGLATNSRGGTDVYPATG